MNVAILGYGVVGSGVVEIIDRLISTKGKLKVTKILDLKDLNDERLVGSIDEITRDENVDTVVECMGGIEPAKKFILACLNAKKHVVTSNKAVVSKNFREFSEIANKNNVGFFVEATAGGGVPWIHNILRAKRIDEICEFSGIINGTSNFIISKMENEASSFDSALKLAQEKGYAEADPSADIYGDDVAAKASISTSIAFDTNVNFEIPTAGIANLKIADIEFFKSKHLAVRMIARGKLKNNKLCVCVEPQLFLNNTLEGNTPGYFNTVTFVGKTIGELKFFGAGAGSLPTANAIVQDLLDCNDGLFPTYSFENNFEFDETLILSSYLYRTTAEDALPKNAIMISPGYFEIYGKHPLEAHKIYQDLLLEDPDAFMASLQETV